MNKRNLMYLLLICVCWIWINETEIIYASPLKSMQIWSEEKHSVSRAEQKGWRYKVIDGKLYKRLFNYTTKEWIGDWVLVDS